ncbi:MAG: hypothetical protein JJD98_04920 [Polaromonas sp.]|nr:hypothetical protein [Polaromonas sp.]
MTSDTRKLFLEGLSEPSASWAARWFDLDIFAAGYNNASIAGIVLVGLGGGLGLQLARRWRARKKD